MSDWLEIHALADEQLGAEEKARVQQRLTDSEESQRELRAIQMVKDAAYSRRDTITCEQTWKRCQRRLDEMDKAHRIEGFVGRYAWALCSVFLLVIVSAGLMNRNQPSLGASDVPRMAANLTPFLSSPKSQDARTQQRFIERNAGQAASQIQADPRIYLIQGANAVIDGHEMSRLDFKDSSGIVILYAYEGVQVHGVEPVPGREGFYYAQVNDTNCVVFHVDDYSIVLQGRRSVEDLCDFANKVCRR